MIIKILLGLIDGEATYKEEKMKRVFGLTVMLVCLLAAAPGVAQQVWFDGEGYLTPTEKSMIAIDPGLVNDGRVARQQGGTVTVTPLAGDFPHIVLLTTVRDGNGNPVTGLTRDDFVITEQSATEGSPVTEEITCFVEFQTGGGMGGGIRFSLVFDLSESMRGDRLADAKTAATNFLQNCAEDDRGSLVSFSTGGLERIEREMNWITTDADQNGSYDIVDAVNALEQPQLGLTAVYDGIAMGIESLGGEPSPKAVVIFTDGETNSDRSFNINEIIAQANSQGVLVYTIGLGVDPQNLRDLADATGGLYYYAPTAQDMNAVYEDIYDEIVRVSRSQYAICYNTHNPAHDGTTRTVSAVSDSVPANGVGAYTVNFGPEITRDESTIALSASPQAAGTDLVISGTVIDNDAETLGQTLSAHLLYRMIDQGMYTDVPLELQNQGGGTYSFSATIPAAAVLEPVVRYQLIASDGIVQANDPGDPVIEFFIPVGDNHPPVITHTPVSSGTAAQAIPVSAQITDPDGDTIDTATLFYRPHNPYQEDAFYMSAVMTSEDEQNFAAEIPAGQVTVSGIDYFIVARDNNLLQSENGSANAPHFVQVGNNSYTSPTANAGPDAAVDEGTTVALDGTGSTDPDGGMAYQWVQTDGPVVTLSNENSSQPTFSAPLVGPEGDSVAFQLTVYDDSCLYSTDTVTVAVNDTPLAAQFSWSPSPASTDEAITFTDMSTPGGQIATWEWDFGGQGTSAEQNPVFAFQNAGEYPVTLRVVDSNGTEDTITQTVAVQSTATEPCDDCEGDGGCFIENTTGSSWKGVAGIGLFMLFSLLLPFAWKHARGKTNIFLIFIIPVLIAAIPMAARAENKANALTISPMVGYYVFDDDQNIDKDFIGALGIGYNFTENVSAELMGTYGQFVHYYLKPPCECCEEDLDGHTLHLDGLYHFRPDENFVPYLAIGVGGTNLDFDNSDGESSFMANWGGGMKYFFSENVALRADARHIYVFDDGYNNVAGTVGLTFQLPFGPKPPPSPTPAPVVQPKSQPKQPEKKEDAVTKKEGKTTPKISPITPKPTPVATPVPVTKTKREVWVRLRIQFDFDKSVVKSKYHDEIKRVADLLKRHPDVAVVIEGHTCNIGTEAYNQRLSQRRADSVKRYLVNKFDISASRLETKGYGELEPEFDNKTREGRRKNRRVIVVKMIEVVE